MVQSSPALLSVTGLAREYLLQEEEGQRDMMLKQKTRAEFNCFFFPIEIKYHHSLSFLNSIYFKALILQIYFISINVPCSVDLKIEMIRYSF